MAENGHIKDGFGSCTKTCILIPRCLNLYDRERSYKGPCLVPWLQYLAFLYGRDHVCIHRLVPIAFPWCFCLLKFFKIIRKTMVMLCMYVYVRKIILM